MGLSFFSTSYIKQALFIGSLALSLTVVPATASQTPQDNIRPIDRNEFDIAPVIPDLNNQSGKKNLAAAQIPAETPSEAQTSGSATIRLPNHQNIQSDTLPQLSEVTNNVSDLSQKTNVNQNSPVQFAQAGVSDGSKASTASGTNNSTGTGNTANTGTSSAVTGNSDGTTQGTASSGLGINNAGNASSGSNTGVSAQPKENGAAEQADSNSAQKTPESGTASTQNSGANSQQTSQTPVAEHNKNQPNSQQETQQKSENSIGQNPDAAASPANAPAGTATNNNSSTPVIPVDGKASDKQSSSASQNNASPATPSTQAKPVQLNNISPTENKPAQQNDKPSEKQVSSDQSTAKQDQNDKLPEVHVLTMGGTIAGKKTDAKIGYEAAVLTGQQMVDTIPELGQIAHLDVKEIAQIASQNITLGHWKTLAESIENIRKDEANTKGKGVVITHGTDTMAMTAFFLSMVFPSGEPIVLTGSMRPSDAVGADGPANLKDAITLAKSEEAKNRGPLLLLNQKIYSARHVIKMNPQTVEAFVDLHQGPVGEITKDGAVFYTTAHTQQLADVDLKTFFHDQKAFPKVGIFYQHPDADTSLIQKMVDDGYKGIILAGVGHGNVSDAGWPILEKAAKKGVIVVRSSQAQGGIVSRNGEINDDEKGFVASLDLNPQNARILTQLALMAGYKTTQDIQPLFSEKSPFSKK